MTNNVLPGRRFGKTRSQKKKEDVAPKKTEITTASESEFESGDLIIYETLDDRWWRRLLHWALMLDPPMIAKTFRISSARNSTLTITALETKY